MLELIEAGGWLMWPILLCSVIGASIVMERLWTLQRKRVLPAHLRAQVWRWLTNDELNDENLKAMRQGSPLGRMLASGLVNRHKPREIMKESIEDTGRQVVHELDRYLNTLGTISAISPLLGLLGTVVGLMKVFTAITSHGTGDPTVLAGGISEALITTVAGLSVAIPALIAYRYLKGKVDDLVVHMEEEAIKLVEAVDRQTEMAPQPESESEPEIDEYANNSKRRRGKRESSAA
ncbi:MAG TPA: MotA/TolQ/ExbB proton channel family protein [Gammaproteobacteria bacterium]|nr:MotA/TolQ/ExbB proton channel family protein [Gammaproteobacteria bacterium]